MNFFLLQGKGMPVIQSIKEPTHTNNIYRNQEGCGRLLLHNAILKFLSYVQFYRMNWNNVGGKCNLIHKDEIS